LLEIERDVRGEEGGSDLKSSLDHRGAAAARGALRSRGGGSRGALLKEEIQVDGSLQEQ
jgi:hypothetical protein